MDATPHTPRPLSPRLVRLAAWLWSWPWWCRAPLTLTLIVGMERVWFWIPSLPPTGSFGGTVWLVREQRDHITINSSGDHVFLSCPREPGDIPHIGKTYFVDLRMLRNWPTFAPLDVPLIVKDSSTVTVTLERPAPPGSATGTGLSEPVTAEEAQSARAVLIRTPFVGSDRELLARPDRTHRRVYWPGVAHLATIAIRLGLGAALALTLASAIALYAGLGKMALRRRRQSLNLCPHCDYDLTGLDGRPCPECGSTETAHTFPPATSIIPEFADAYEKG